MKSTVKTIGVVTVIMLFSRILAFISTQQYITFFGADLLETNIYTYALSLPNIIFTILGTAITIVIIPIFAGFIGTGEKERAIRFANNIISLSIILTCILVILGIALTPNILNLTKYRGNSFAILALKVMFPIMIFYGLNYVFQGILQSMGRFNMPAFVSVPSSLIVISYVYIWGSKYGLKGLLFATFIGLSLQAIILIPSVLKTGFKFFPSFNYRDRDVINALKLVPPILIGTSAYQINMLFNSTLVAREFEKSVSLIGITQQILLYSILAVIYSITAVIFPKLTKLAAQKDFEKFKHNLLKVLKSVLYFIIPASFGFIAVRSELITFLVGWGKITQDNLDLASKLLGLYAIGVIGIGIKEVIDRAYFSIKDTKTPAYVGLLIMGINIGLSLLFVYWLKMNEAGIPLAYSISTTIGGIVLIILMKGKIGDFGIKSLFTAAFKYILCSAIMMIIVIFAASFMVKFNLGLPFIDKAVKLGIPVLVGVIAYIILTLILKVEETKEVMKKLKLRI